ncbi:hypothetical protein LZC95_50135 [Pendulispora brunnea]|uniref:Uncharacterized protein n=1 Tax=Pendulispora brunnea TaxID=2905690 RepID=A0ABZ2KDW7_9BACT
MPRHAVMDAAHSARSYALAGALVTDVDLQAEGGAACTAIRVGTAGDLAVVCASGIATVLPALLAGETIHVQAVKLSAAGTTAQKLTAFW